MDLPDEEIYVVSSPCADIGEAARVRSKRCRILVREAVLGIWIEVVVHMDAVDVVSAHNIGNDPGDVIAHVLQAGIQDPERARIQNPFGMQVCDVLGR